VVTNREPYSHNKKENKIITKKSSGGVVSALDPLMIENGGTWIAWGSGNADFQVCNTDSKVLVPDNKPSYFIKRITLSDDEVENYYRGYSNRVLWPLFHLFVEKMHMNDKYWKSYVDVNKKFSKAIIEEISQNKHKDNYIWIHDYHLSLVPKFIKNRINDAKIAYFWHIPWPPWEIFGILPQREQILEGLLSSDLLGFHTTSYVDNFIKSALKNTKNKVDVKNSTVISPDNQTSVKSFPLGIKHQEYTKPLNSNEVKKEINDLEGMYKNKKMILGIDRLDYTKGILDRIKSYEQFLKNNPEYKEKVVLVQIATPSRYQIKEYLNMKKEIDEAVGKINGEYGTETWTPVTYFFRRIPQSMLLAYYHTADVGLLTPIRDGMNLIAKEFTTTNEKDGVLILSEFAGAAEQLKEAISVNPFDINSVAGAIKTAVDMPKKERKKRIKAMKRVIKDYDAEWWQKSFVKQWEKIYA